MLRARAVGIRTLVLLLWCGLAGPVGPVGPALAAPPEEDECEHFLQRLCCGDENLILISGCTPKQSVPLLLGSGEHEIFVDGERVDGRPRDLRLRADRDHTVFIKRSGYKPELVVLRSEGESGKESLVPGAIELDLERRIERGSLGVEIEEVVEAGDAPAAEPADRPAPPADQPEPPAKQVEPPAKQVEPPARPLEPLEPAP
jgi:hypothetical protein